MVKQFEGNRGGFRGGRGGAPRGGGRGGFGRSQDQGPPSFVVPYCTYMHRSQNTFVVKCTDMTRFPKFNRAIFLENKAKLGTVDEIFGPVNDFYFSVKPSEGVDPSNFKPGQVFYMSPEDLLSTDKFTKPQAPRPKGPGGPRGGQGGFGGGRSQGGFGGRPQGGFGGRPQGGFQGRPQGQGNFGNQRGRAPFQKR